MRRPCLVPSVVSFVCVTLLASPPGVEGAESTSSTVTVVAGFGPRTSLKVSSDNLQFAAREPDAPAVAVVEFSAGARTQAGAEVMLTVERLPGSDCPGEAAVTFLGEGPGTVAGILATAGPTPVARWTGSGLRKGRLTFLLRAGAGSYNLPIRFVLSAP